MMKMFAVWAKWNLHIFCLNGMHGKQQKIERKKWNDFIIDIKRRLNIHSLDASKLVSMKDIVTRPRLLLDNYHAKKNQLWL